MKLRRKVLIAILMVFSFAAVIAFHASAFKDLGTQPINLGDRIEVTVGPDEQAQFTFTPDRNMRVNIWQDLDQSQMLIHIDPFHMDSWQQHWSTESPFPCKGITFSMKANTTYTMGVASPAQFEGGSFTVYFDLVSYLPDNYFYSGVKEDEPTIPVDAIVPTDLIRTTPEPIRIQFADPTYGTLNPEGIYIFSPDIGYLLRDEQFDILYSNGKTKSVSGSDFQFSDGKPFLFGDPAAITFPTGDTSPELSEPGPLSLTLTWNQLSASIPIEIVEAPEMSGEPTPSGTDSYAYTDHFVYTYDQLKQCVDRGDMLLISNEEYRIEVDASILAMFAEATPPHDLQITLRPVGYDELTEPQKDRLDTVSFTALYEVSYFYEDNVTMLPSPARYTVPARIQPGTGIEDYSVCHIADHGELKWPYTEAADDRISFHFEYPGLFAVINNSAAPDNGHPEEIPEEPPQTPTDGTPGDPPAFSVVEIAADPVLTLPTEQLDLWHAENTGLTVHANDITVTFPPSVLHTAADAVRQTEQITFSLTEADALTLTDAQADTLRLTEYSALYDLSVFSGDIAVHELGGTAVVSVPGAFLPDTAADGYIVCRIDEDGSVLPLTTHVTGGDALVFTTSHFSLFAVLYQPDIDALPLYVSTLVPDTADTEQNTEETLPLKETSRVPQAPFPYLPVILCSAAAAAGGFLIAVLLFRSGKKSQR